MGMEVNWRDMKRISPESHTIGNFIASLMHFISELGKEHQAVLFKHGTPNGFIEEPVLSKHIWDRFQSMHVHTLSCCVMLPPTKRAQMALFYNCVGEIADSGESNTPLHLKIRRWHDSKEEGDLAYDDLDIIRLKSVLVPRQHVLKAIDPDGSKSAEQLRDEILLLAKDYQNIVIRRAIPDTMEVAEVLRIYADFYLVSPAPGWGEIPLSCSCPDSHKNCACEHTVLLASVYDADIFVPDALVADSPSKRKRTRLGRGVAGSRRNRLLAAREEKTHAESKIPYLSMRGAGCGNVASPSPKSEHAVLVVPAPVLPSSDSDNDIPSGDKVCCVDVRMVSFELSPYSYSCSILFVLRRLPRPPVGAVVLRVVSRSLPPPHPPILLFALQFFLPPPSHTPTSSSL